MLLEMAAHAGPKASETAPIDLWVGTALGILKGKQYSQKKNVAPCLPSDLVSSHGHCSL